MFDGKINDGLKKRFKLTARFSIISTYVTLTLLLLVLASCVYTGAPIALMVNHVVEQNTCPYGLTAQITILKNGRQLQLSGIVGEFADVQTFFAYPAYTKVNVKAWCLTEELSNQSLPDYNYIEVNYHVEPSSLFDSYQGITVVMPNISNPLCPPLSREDQPIVIHADGIYPCMIW